MDTPPAPLASHDAPTSGGQGLIGPRPRSPPPPVLRRTERGHTPREGRPPVWPIKRWASLGLAARCIPPRPC